MLAGPLTTIVNGKVVVVGIGSVITNNCNTSRPMSFARVSSQKNWILENTDAGNYQCNISTGVKIKLLNEYFVV